MDVPKVSIRRLCKIYRLLERLHDSGRKIIFSDEIGESTGVPTYQIRKDISFLGEVGKPGRGYDVLKLKDHIAGALNLTGKITAGIAGVGRLGSALLNYINLPKSKYDFVAAFDNNPKMIGKKENGVPIYSNNDIKSIVKKEKIEAGIITVPSEAAQEVADALIEGGVTSILNFAPIEIQVPDDVIKRCIDFSLEMNFLTALKSVKSQDSKLKQKKAK